MCGIAGILKLDKDSFANPRSIDHMLESIVHRGPDDCGQLIDGPLAMGMRRLSIIDLAAGQQPMFDESGRFGIVFNGEIYNYRELREDLTGRGHKFRTKSDTEVIVHLFEEHGAACVDHLRGMFGFALWDNRERELFIARDRLGIKPLYFTEQDESLIFASEIKALLRHPSVPSSLDHRALSEYLSLKYVPAPRTMFDGIRSLPPGHALQVRNGRISVVRYWDVSFAKPTTTRGDAEYKTELLALLRESVRLRLRSDVPFGAFLSGGIDSSMIVALMAEAMGEPVKTFSVGFDGGSAGGGEPDELPYAQLVADQFGCDHHTLTITARDFIDHAERVLWHLDQPIADQATVATHMVAKLARQHVKMVLTGEGGDELFAGYARYEGERLSPWFQMIPTGASKPMRQGFVKMPGMRRAKIALNALTIRDEATRFANWFPLMSDELKADLLRPRMGDAAADAAAVFAHHLNSCDATTPLDRMLYADMKLWLPDYLLLRGDKLTMANSLEARLPLLDHKLVEFTAALPENMKLRGRTRKYLLKQAASELIPARIIHRKKQGFPIPIQKWLRCEANDMLHDLLSAETFRSRGLFDFDVVARLIKQHESGYADRATELWGLMSVEMWLQMFADQTTTWSDQPIERIEMAREVNE